MLSPGIQQWEERRLLSCTVADNRAYHSVHCSIIYLSMKVWSIQPLPSTEHCLFLLKVKVHRHWWAFPDYYDLSEDDVMLCQFLHSDRAPFFGILMVMPWLQSSGIFYQESWKDWPRFTDYPLTPTPLTTLQTTPQTTLWTTPRTTLNKQPNLCLQGKRHKKPTCSASTITTVQKSCHFLSTNFLEPVFFHFRPVSSSPTNQNPVSIVGRCWISISLLCLKRLPWTLSFAKNITNWNRILVGGQWNLIHLFVMSACHLRWSRFLQM